MITTHTLGSTEVGNFQTLDTVIDSDEGPRHLLIFTGIAPTRWNSKGNVDLLTQIVKLGLILEEVPTEHEWSAVVGLSNISNRDSNFIYAINGPNPSIGGKGVSLGMDPKTNELQLSVDIAVLGEGGEAVLDSFSFQVTVLTKPPKIELAGLLIRGGVFAPTATTLAGSGWEGEVILKSPAPRDVDVFLFSGNPSVAPLRASGDPSFTPSRSRSAIR